MNFGARISNVFQIPLKIVISGDDLPSVVVPNVVGRGGDKVYVGQEALDRAMVYQANLTRPMENCEVIKRADMKVILISFQGAFSLVKKNKEKSPISNSKPLKQF